MKKDRIKEEYDERQQAVVVRLTRKLYDDLVSKSDAYDVMEERYEAMRLEAKAGWRAFHRERMKAALFLSDEGQDEHYRIVVGITSRIHEEGRPIGERGFTPEEKEEVEDLMHEWAEKKIDDIEELVRASCRLEADWVVD